MSRSLKLLCLGDISLAGFTQTHFQRSSGYAALVQQLKNYDGITIANLECALTTNKHLNLNKIALSANPALLSQVSFIDAFSLANNHVSDAWEEGVQDTMRALNQEEKAYFGYGQNILDARIPLLLERDGVRLGFLGYSCLSTNGENYATTMKPGVWDCC